MGGSRLTPSSCFGGGRRFRSVLGLHREPLGSVGLRGGSRAGHWLRRRAAGNATGGAHWSPEPRCARRASEQHREPPLPCAAPSPRDAPQPGAETRACSRGSRGALFASPHNLFPELSPAGPRFLDLRFALSAGALQVVGRRGGRFTLRTLTRPWARGRSFPLSSGSVVLSNPHFGGGGRRERCWAREWGKMLSN